MLIEITDEWAERLCAAMNEHPDGTEGKLVEGQFHTITFREKAKNIIRLVFETGAQYPCSPLCEGYLREKAARETAPTGVRLYSRLSDLGGGSHLIVEVERADGSSAELIRDFAGSMDTTVDHWARI